MQRITINTSPVADKYSDKSIERILEFHDPETNLGGLISFRRSENGSLQVHLYRLDPKVNVTVAEVL